MSKKDKWLDNDGLDAQVAALLAERNTLKEKVAELVVERTRLRVKVGKLTAERDRWMSNAHGAQALSLEYLRELDALRKRVTKLEDGLLQITRETSENFVGRIALEALNREKGGEG